MIIYQVFTRLFGNHCLHPVHDGTLLQNGCGKMADFTLKALEDIRSLGATHIWYTGVIEHATQTDYSDYGIRPDHHAVVKGKAGSPYAIKDYFDIDPDLATDVPNRMREFENLVNRTHKAGLKMIIDFVPNHVARQYQSDACPEGIQDLGAGDDQSVMFSTHNNFYYLPGQTLDADFPLDGYDEHPARVSGNDVFSSFVGRNDWYETVKLNYGIDVFGGRVGHFDTVPSTWTKMRDILLFWAAKGIDGFRCDMAEMVPVEFWGWAIPQVKEQFPEIIFIAEVYNPAEYRNYVYRGEFDYLYDKVGLYDTLKAVVRGEWSAQSITHCWQAVEDIKDHMLNFLENHDEQRLASDFFAGDARKGRPALLVSALMQSQPFMVYFGQELGERGMEEEGFSGRDGRTTIFDYYPVDTVLRWRNAGKFDGKRLTEEEKDLRNFYQRVLTLKQEDPALNEGAFFDLMYVNQHLHRQYVFCRKSEKELVLVVANFEDAKCDVDVFIPEDLVRCWSLPEEIKGKATDLLTGKKTQVDIAAGNVLPIMVEPLSGAVLSIKLPKKNKK